jgi:hypothetical protein
MLLWAPGGLGSEYSTSAYGTVDLRGMVRQEGLGSFDCQQRAPKQLSLVPANFLVYK